MLGAPIIKTGKLEGQLVFDLSFNEETTRTILIIDSGYGLTEDIPRDTFKNICFVACKTTGVSANFIYVGMDSVKTDIFEKIKAKVKPDAIVYASEDFVRLSGVADPLFLFGQLYKKQVFVVPFRYWTNAAFTKAAAGPNLLGYTLRGLCEAISGENIGGKPKKPEVDFVNVTTIDAFDDMLSRMKAVKVVAVDTETTSLGKITSQIITAQFGIREEDGSVTAFFLPLVHRDTPWSAEDFKYINKKIRSYFLTTDAELIFHTASFDVGQFLTALKIKHFPAAIYDVSGGEFLLDENSKFLRNIYGIQGPYTLEFLETKHGIKREQGLIGKEDRKNMASFSLKEIFTYACWDVVTLHIIRDRQIRMSTHPLYGFKSRKAFRRLNIQQIGMMQKVFAIMQHNGIQLDLDHVFELVKKSGPFDTAIAGIYEKLMSFPSVQKANEIILKKRGATGGGLFATDKTKRVLELTKPDHRVILFLDVMGLEPLRKGKSGVGSTDSAFQKAYAAQHPEVALYQEFGQLQKLKTAFAESLIQIVLNDPDFKIDKRVRPGYSFLPVVTGRLASFKPNAQQVPTRGSLAKQIKKAFIAKARHVMIGSDFSAHEIRMSGNIARDKIVTQTFKKALRIINKYRTGPIPNDIDETLAKLEQDTDIHLMNVQIFYGLTVNKKHPLRSSIKNTVFSTIYGAMANKIARTSQSGELQAALDSSFLKKKELEKLKQEDNPDKDKFIALKKEIAAAKEIIEKPFEKYVDEAEDAQRRLSDKWRGLWNWMETTKEEASKTFMAYYPNDRVRHLWGYLSSDVWVHRAMDRRAVNSIVQGFSSDVGVASAYLGNDWAWRNCWSKKIEFSYAHINIVHDANYKEVLFEHIPLAVYVTEHSMSTMPYKFYRDVFGYEFLVELGYDLDIGLRWDSLKEWKKRPEQLYDMIRELGDSMKIESKHVVRDAMKIMEIRTREIERDRPDFMYLDGERFDNFLPKLTMFNS